jgi:hypothetical protein
MCSDRLNAPAAPHLRHLDHHHFNRHGAAIQIAVLLQGKRDAAYAIRLVPSQVSWTPQDTISSSAGFVDLAGEPETRDERT